MDRVSFREAVEGHIDRSWVAPTVDLLAEAARSASHGWGHLLRVLRNAERIRDGEVERGVTVDWEVLAAAALLHDLVDLPKDHPERHLASARSGERGVEHFVALGVFDEARRENLRHAIEAHSFSAGVPAESVEAEILTDADRLETLGAIGIARVFQVSGELGRPICDMADPFAEGRELDDGRWAIDHFARKVLKVKDRFYTPTGRALAEQRHEFVVGYLEQLGDELG